MKMDIIEIEKQRLAWSFETFPDATSISSLRKLESELKEIEADIMAGKRIPEEFADALMCLFDSAGRIGINVEQITKAYDGLNLIFLEHVSEILPDPISMVIFDKLRAKIKDIEVRIISGNNVPEEFANALMCLIGIAQRHGISREEITSAYAIKFEINKKRTWVKNDDNSYSHVKSTDQ